MILRLFFNTLYLFIACNVFAQLNTDTAIATNTTAVEGRSFDAAKLVLGGNLGATFGDFTFINVSPQLGYRFSDHFTAGAGVNFIYSSDKFFVNGIEQYRYNNGYAGLNLFARYFPAPFIFLSSQSDINYHWGKIKYTDNYLTDKQLAGKMIPSFLVGAGVVVGGNGRGGMMISFQYDIIQNIRSPYGTKPFLNVGFAF